MSKSHVLLVEPDRILSQTYQRALESQGYQVESAGNAQSAITKADNRKPDLVVLELQLIEHSGIEFLYEFRSYPEWQNIPVIIQTQVPFGEFIDNWQFLKQELGVSAYLYKPHTSLRQLLNQISKELLVKV